MTEATLKGATPDPSASAAAGDSPAEPAIRPDARPRRRLRRVVRFLVILPLVLILLVTALAAGYDLATAGTVAVPPLDANGHYIRTGDLDTHYEQWGESGTPIVLVHGFLESASIWNQVGPLLATNHRVYALDVRGYGYTQRRGPYTLASDTDQLTAFLAALDLDAAHGGLPMLVGHSSGAAIIGDLARLHPQDVARIVFLDGDGTPYGVGPVWIHKLLVNPYLTAAIHGGTRHPSLAASVYRSTCGPGCPPFDTKAWITPLRVAGADAALGSILRRQLIGLTFSQELQIRTPATIVYGSDDPEMSTIDAVLTVRRLRASQVISIPGARHLAMLSAPAALVSALAAADRQVAG